MARKDSGDLRQKLSDLKLLLKEDRKVQVIAICLALSVVYLMTADDSNSRRRRKIANNGSYTAVEETELGSAAIGQSESYTDLVTAFNTELKELRTEQKSIVQNLNERRKETEEYEARVAEIFKRILERMADQELASQSGGNMIMDPNGALPDPIDVVAGDDPDYVAARETQNQYEAAPVPPEQLEAFGLENGEAVAPPAPPPPTKMALIGTGDNVRIKLLAGVNAPTDGTPYPVMFKLSGDVLGPDGSALPLGEARLIAAAQGSLVDSRAIFRLTDLSIRMPDGSRQIVKVDGWVVGEDGLRGMPGVLIDPLGKYIAGAAIVGGVGGLGQAISDGETRTIQGEYGIEKVVDGDVGKFAAGQALASATNRWTGLISERLEALSPQVQVKSGRTATAIFSQPVVIPGLFEALEDYETNAFASLD